MTEKPPDIKAIDAVIAEFGGEAAAAANDAKGRGKKPAGRGAKGKTSEVKESASL